MIINALIIGAAIIISPFIVSSFLTADYMPAAILGAMIAFLSAFFVFKDTLCIWPLLGSGMALSLNFLPIPLDAPHLFCVLLILYYITGYLIIRQKRMKLGNPAFLWPIVTIVLILIYHDHTFSFGNMGNSDGTQGQKPAYLIYLVFVAYFCALNITSPSLDFFSKIPLYTVTAAGLSSIPFVVSTIVPGMGPFIHLISNNINGQAYADSQSNSTGGETGMGRITIFASMGLPLQSYLLCRYPIGTWIRPERWWILVLSFICLLCAIVSGFRNVLFGFIIITLVASWCYYSWRALFLPITFFFICFVLGVASSNKILPLPLNKLPLIAQRTMSFLPGDWDPEAIESARTSNDFRNNMQSVYIKEYLTRSPLIGIGYNIDTKTYNDLSAGFFAGGSDPAYLQAKVFIEGQIYHTGWMSLYDIVGIIGFIAFLTLAYNEILMVAGFVFGPKADRRSSLFPLYVWLFTNLVSMMISFFTVFGDFSLAFTNLIINAIVLTHISEFRKSKETPAGSSERKIQPEFSRSGEARYGYQSKY